MCENAFPDRQRLFVVYGPFAAAGLINEFTLKSVMASGDFVLWLNATWR